MPPTPMIERYPILEFFTFDHLKADLREVSHMTHDLAVEMAERLPRHPETSAGLRHLLEAKDCFVRAAIVGLRLAASASDRPA